MISSILTAGTKRAARSYAARAIASSSSSSLVTSRIQSTTGRAMLVRLTNYEDVRYYSNRSSILLKSTSFPDNQDDDLDEALNDILEKSGDSSFVTNRSRSEFHESSQQERSSTTPKSVDEYEKVDYSDEELRNTSNPRWVQAGLNPKIIEILSEKGITHLTPVQAEAFDPVLAGRDVIGRSRTGTGKTLGFGIPALTRLVKWTEECGKRDSNGRMRPGRKVSMLVLCPTRELARQVQEELAMIAKPLNLFTTVFHGGVSYNPQVNAIERGVDVVVGTPGRVIDHIQNGTLDLSECDCVVLDEADEMLNMGFADDVEVILEGVGEANDKKSQCLLFSATTPSWVKNIARQYQKDVLSIDSTKQEGGGARVATTVRHLAVQLPPGIEAKKAVLEDIIAVEISKEVEDDNDVDSAISDNPIAAAALLKKNKSSHAMQQKIFGKTIVFTQTKKDADEIVSTGVFKSLSAQAIHGDVGQKQRDATINAFRRGAFNVLVATDVAARGIDIQDVDLVIQLDPPREVDAYVHRSGRTGRAGRKGVSILLFSREQARDIVSIERDLGHGFKFDLVGPPSTEAALKAAAKTSAIACMTIPEETASYFKDAATSLLQEEGVSPEDVVSKCLAAISRRSTVAQSRSLLTGEVGMATVEMSYGYDDDRPVSPRDVMFTVGKLSRMSQSEGGDLSFDSDVGKINTEDGSAIFDMGAEDARKLIEFSKDIDAGGAVFSIKHELDIKRGRYFGKERQDFRNRGGRNNGQNFRGGRGNGNNRWRSNNNYNNRGRHFDGRNNHGNGRRDGGGGGYNRNRRGHSYDNGGGRDRRQKVIDNWNRGNRYDDFGSDGGW